MIKMVSGPIKKFSLGIFDGPHATPRESDSGPIFLGIKNVTSDGRLDFSKIRHVSEEEFPKWTRRVTPQADDIVFSYEATLHRYAIIPEGFNGCLGRRMALVRPDKKKICPRFLHYYFMSHQWYSVIEANIISGATVDRIPIKKLPDFEVSVPHIEVQKTIADILSAYDNLIENNQRRIQLLEQAARLLYKEWFVQLRFPGYEHVKIIDGVPEGWERVVVPDIIDINPKESIPKDSDILYVPMSCLSEAGMTIDRSGTEMRQKATTVKFRNGDTLFARITPCLENGKTGFMDFLEKSEVACGSTEFIILRGRSVSPYFVYCLARTHDFRENAIKSMIGSSGRQRVQVSCFDDFTFGLPPKKFLFQFDDTASHCFLQIKNLMRQNEQLRLARDLLLPRFMNGEIVV